MSPQDKAPVESITRANISLAELDSVRRPDLCKPIKAVQARHNYDLG